MTTTFEELGGAPFFEHLVAAFYDRVEHNPILRPMYPDDLTSSKYWFALFLEQYFGGPGEYSEKKGHPRLRMRHGHLQIGVAARNAWLEAMVGAIEEVGIAEPIPLRREQ